MYVSTLNIFRQSILSDLEDLIEVPLMLTMNDYNLLEDAHSCISSSTALGFILEEYIVHYLGRIRPVFKTTKATNTCSYDCYSIFNDTFIMINIKAERKTNSAVAAINQLHRDYAAINQPKAYLVLKAKYKLEDGYIIIKGFSAYYLEELDLSIHQQDYRSWGETNNLNSGRLIVSNKFLKSNYVPLNELSSIRTIEHINDIFENNSQ